MHIRPASLNPLSLVGLFLVGCAALPVVGTGYFPLDPGIRWHYQVTVDRPDGQWHSILEIVNVDGFSVGNTRYHTRRGDSGTEYLYLDTPEGILQAGTIGAFDRRPQLEPVPQPVLPYPLVADQQWQRQSSLRILSPWQVAEHSGGQGPPKVFALSHRIAAMSDEVTVPAGRFHDAIRVESEALVDWPRAAGNGPLRISTREWYASGVGLVSLERDERLGGSRPLAGSMRMELIAVDRVPR